jgi:hypothetical protein
LAAIPAISPSASADPIATLLVAGLEGGSGSTVGPGGALFVTESIAGRISRVDPQTGTTTTYASGLPIRILGFGGAVDVAFIGDTAYALVTLVGSIGICRTSPWQHARRVRRIACRRHGSGTS